MTGEEDESSPTLSAPVRAALDPGVDLVESLLRELTAPAQEEDPTMKPPPPSCC